MPLDADVARLLAQIEDPVTPRIELLDVSEMRASAALMTSWMGDAPAIAGVRHVAIPGPAGPIMARVYYPATGKPLPLLAFFHGRGLGLRVRAKRRRALPRTRSRGTLAFSGPSENAAWLVAPGIQPPLLVQSPP